MEWLGRQSVDEIRDDQRIDQPHGVSMEIVEDPGREEPGGLVVVPESLDHLCRSSIGSFGSRDDEIVHTIDHFRIIRTTTEHLPYDQTINHLC